jgi:hypothetical protein
MKNLTQRGHVDDEKPQRGRAAPALQTPPSRLASVDSKIVRR